jgi:hypothetical protein
LDELILREKLTILPWTSTYDINTELSSLLKMQTPREIYQRYFLSILNNYKEYQEVYADASKTQDQVGISIILKNKYILFKLANTCSVCTAEATARLEAIKTFIDDEHSNHIICNDSLDTLNSIN